jgi:hypothetical protein
VVTFLAQPTGGSDNRVMVVIEEIPLTKDSTASTELAAHVWRWISLSALLIVGPL